MAQPPDAGQDRDADHQRAPDRDRDGSSADVLTVALLVFFVSLLMVVGALLLVPTLLPPAR